MGENVNVPRAGRPVKPFQVWYTIDGIPGERDQIVFAFDSDHAKRVFAEWVRKNLAGHTVTIKEIV